MFFPQSITGNTNKLSLLLGYLIVLTVIIFKLHLNNKKRKKENDLIMKKMHEIYIIYEKQSLIY